MGLLDELTLSTPKVKEVASYNRAPVVNESNKDSILLPDEPVVFNGFDIDKILSHAHKMYVSDVFIRSNDKIKVKVNSGIWPISRHIISKLEMEEFITRIWGSGASSQLNGNALDKAYSIKNEDNPLESLRFRLNVSSDQYGGGMGYDLTARIIPNELPYLGDMGLPTDLLEALLSFQKGMAVITGATGSGKSTLLAAIISEFLRNHFFSKRILTSEAPIEFSYDSLLSDNSIISQSEVPLNFKDFTLGTRAALRRAPNIILVGEARDKETILEAVTAGKTGHELFTTVHSNGFTDTLSRMLSNFEGSEKNAMAVDLISNMRIVCSQQLVPTVEGRRVALREYVIFNSQIADELLEGGVENLTYTSSRILQKYGRSFAQDAEEKYNAGIISKRTYENILFNIKKVKEGVEDEIFKEIKEKEMMAQIKLLTEQMNKQNELNTILINKLLEQQDFINHGGVLHQEVEKQELGF